MNREEKTYIKVKLTFSPTNALCMSTKYSGMSNSKGWLELGDYIAFEQKTTNL